MGNFKFFSCFLRDIHPIFTNNKNELKNEYIVNHLHRYYHLMIYIYLNLKLNYFSSIPKS